MKFYRRLVICLTAVMLCAVLLTSLPLGAQAVEGEISALFINVRKADCAVLFLEDQTWLVDTGTKDSADAMLRALSVYGVEHLNGVIITHTDKDHVGGLKSLLKSDIKVDRLYASKLHSEESDEKHPVSKASVKYEVPMTWLSAGDVLTIDEQTNMTVLGPVRQDTENENNNSLVIHLKTSQGDMLLTGDMELEEEQDLMGAGVVPGNVAVLKVAHHGEDDASGQAFIYRARPQWAVISTNTEDEPDTPDSKIIARLWDVKSNVAVTQNAECGILVRLSGGVASAETIGY